MWLSLFAYIIRAGVALGLVETEPETAEGRAYIRAHDALLWLRVRLGGSRIESVDAFGCRYVKREQPMTISVMDGKLVSSAAVSRGLSPLQLDLDASEVNLGPRGSVVFAYVGGRLKVVLVAGDDSTGRLGTCQVELEIAIPGVGHQ